MKKNDISVFAQFAKGKKKPKRKTEQKCVIYTRVSHSGQVDNTSLATQIDACRKYAKDNKLNVVQEFGGTYESAKSDEDRKEFTKMLTFLKGNRKVGTIIVYSLDRFSRTGGHAIALIENLKAKGIDVHAVTQPADTDTASGKLMQQIQMVFSNFDNNLRRDKSTGGMLKRMNAGYYCGPAPIGYQNVKIDGVKNIAPDKRSAKFIKLAFKWKAKEGITNEEVRTRLKARGFTIARQTLSRTIRNPLYCGMICHPLLNGKVVPGKHTQLTTVDNFLLANGINQRFKKPSSYCPEKAEVALKRFLCCEKCDKPLRGYIVKKKGLWYYKCSTVGCKVNRNAKQVHNLFLSELKKYTVPEHFISPIRDQLKALLSGYFDSQKEELRLLKAQLPNIEVKIDKLETKYLFDEIPASLYEKHKERLEAEKSKIEAEIERAGKQVSNLDSFAEDAVKIMRNLNVLWENGDYEERQRIQNLVFPSGMRYCKENDECRTDRVNSIFALTAKISNFLDKKKVGTSEMNFDVSHLASRRGVEPLLPE